MSTNLSNEFLLDLTLNDVIFETYDILQVASDGESITGGLFNRAVASLNIMLKLWESQGIHLWTFTEGSLFLRVGQASFDFREEGFNIGNNAETIDNPVVTHLTNEFIQLALGEDITDEATNQIVLEETSATLTVGWQIAWINNDNDLIWRVVIEVLGTTVVLSESVDAEGLSITGNIVYAYEYFANTTIVGTAAAAQNVVTVDLGDTPLFTIGDNVLLQLDTGFPFEFEIADINQGTGDITFTEDLPDASQLDAPIINLDNTPSVYLPIKRISNDMVRRRESTDYEIPIVFQSRKDYFDLPNKNQNGTPIQAYYDRQEPQGVMFLWNPPGSAVPIINFTYERQMMVFTNDPEQTFDLPSDWFDAIVYNLAQRLMIKVGCSQERKVDIKAGAQEYLDNALAMDQGVYPIRLKPQKYG